jgi:hypothetical protein
VFLAFRADEDILKEDAMIRQISRLILMILAGLWAVARRYPGLSIGAVIGGIIGYVVGKSMTAYGFPGWMLPVMVVACAVKMAAVCKEYLDKLTKKGSG